MSRILYFDCFSGVSGDMILGALVDAGLPIGELRRALGSLAIEGVDVTVERVSRAGVSATKFHVVVKPDQADDHNHGHDGQGHSRIHGHHHHDRGHDHGHDAQHAQPHEPGTHHEHAHRSLADISELIGRSALSPNGKERARALFTRLGEVEAGIHQMPIERIHLHEVGAIDSIVDIVGAVFGLEWFGADQIVASPLNVGSGTVQCEHGTFPVPAPATARLLEGVPIYSSGVAAELVTPTGAVIVTAYAGAFGPLPPMRVERIGYGAGDRDLPEAPNVLRILGGEAAGASAVERIVVLECEIDDMNPQLYGHVMDRLYDAGALEVFYAPVQMKKNRPGTLVTVVARPERRDELAGVLFRETTTIGVRFRDVDRERLDRESLALETPVGTVRVKIARRRGDIVNASPEYEDCARLARERGMSVKQVQALAMKAYLDTQT
ncbi:MAG: nickel pincer cofactor biosynthesis protein LarC [Acidobacteria bacterium]|nr:nickel pincer cofactor biosynthesis protein LarC [Acidobacteriota bacterium]